MKIFTTRGVIASGQALEAGSVYDVSDKDASTFALIETLQREDLNPLEEASGYHRLQEEFGLTQDDLARVVGKSRSTVANSIRLLGLGTHSKQLLQSGHL